MPSPLVGTVINGKYRIVRGINGGGQSKVYTAVDLERNKEVAIKLLDSEDFGAFERAEREAGFYRRIKSNNVMFIQDSGVLDDEKGIRRFYCVFPLVIHGTMETMLLKDGAIKPLSRALELLSQVANGLKDIHAGGLVHRDIKPANLLLHKKGGIETVLITDFGIAIEAESRASGAGEEAYSRNLTMNFHILGSPEFMAPQQCVPAGISAEKDRERKDQRNDVFSLGILAHLMLTGKLPYPNLSDTQIMGFVNDKSQGKVKPFALSDREVPAEVAKLVESCKSYELKDRPLIGDVVAELSRIKLEETGSSIPPPSISVQLSGSRFKTPGQTRVSEDAVTMIAPSTPPTARKSDPKVVISSQAHAGSAAKPRTRVWMAFVPLTIAVLVVVGWILLGDKLEEKRTGMPAGPMISEYAAAPSAPPAQSANTPASASAMASAKPRPLESEVTKPKSKKASGRPAGNYQGTPPTENFDPSQPMPPPE